MDLNGIVKWDLSRSNVAMRSVLLLVVSIGTLLLISVTASASSFVPKGYQANADPQASTTALLGRFGELIARERAYNETAYELEKSARGESPHEMDSSMLDAVLGKDFYTLYDQVLPILEKYGQQSRRDQIELRFDPAAQKKLIEGKRVAGINEGAVNLVEAHYKIAIEQLDATVYQLLLAESHLMRRAADELAKAFDDSGKVVDYVSYVRASRLVSAPRQVKGFVQPRCAIESDAVKQSRTIRNAIDDNFYFNQDMKFQTSVQETYDAAGLVEAQAMMLSGDGSHCD